MMNPSGVSDTTVEIIGDDQILADMLGVNQRLLAWWKSEEMPIPEGVFFMCVDIVVSDAIHQKHSSAICLHLGRRLQLSELTQRVNRRQRVARRKCDELTWPGDEERIDVNAERADSILNERGEGCLKVAIGPGLNDRQSSPSASAAACTSLVSAAAFGLIGFTRKPIEADLGSVSCSTSNCLGNRLLAKKLTPVTFPPGRLRLATSPTLMGSAPITKTVGTVVLAAFAARVTGVAPVRITAALRWIKSATSAGSRL